MTNVSRPKTLAEAHKIKILTEKVRLIDDRILAEHTAALLTEALSQQDFKKATILIQKLRDVSAAAQTARQDTLIAGLTLASKDLNQLVGKEGSITGALADAAKGVGSGLLKKLTGVSIDKNPLVKCATLVSALENGFTNLEQILKNNLEDYKFEVAVTDAAKDPDVLEMIEKTIVKAFAAPPKGAIASLGRALGMTGKSLPYIKDLEAFAHDLTAAEGPALKSLRDAVGKNKVSKLANDLVADAGSGAKKGEEAPVEKSDETPAEEKETPAEKPEETKPSKPLSITPEKINDIASKTGVKAAVIKKIIAQLKA